MKIVGGVKLAFLISVLSITYLLAACSSDDGDKDIDSRLLNGSWYHDDGLNEVQVVVSFRDNLARKDVFKDGELIETEHYGTYHLTKDQIQLKGTKCKYTLIGSVLSLEVRYNTNDELVWIDFTKGPDLDEDEL